MITHGNLLHNSALIQRWFRSNTASRGVFWLPLHHDMGLIGGVLQTIYCGGASTLFSPLAFLQEPYRWLETIARTGATISGGPNFAYDLCVRKLSAERRAKLDLSTWTVAFNGAEPIRPESIDRFAEMFAPCGFRREAFLPCYGLAEATLMVSGRREVAPPVVIAVEAAALEQNRVLPAPEAGPGARTLVGSGQVISGQEVVVVDPATGVRCPAECVGEIWVAGPSVARGYWNQREASATTFEAALADADAAEGTQGGRFLRTGDLGFLRNGELFVTGRLKDLIIIGGRNVYPQDIEATVARSHPLLRTDAAAAVAVDLDGEERLVVVQEVERQVREDRVEEITGAIRQALAGEHELDVHAVVLIKAASIPKTSSGKIRRQACRAAFLAGELDVVGSTSKAPAPASASCPLPGRLIPPEATCPALPCLMGCRGARGVADREAGGVVRGRHGGHRSPPAVCRARAGIAAGSRTGGRASGEASATALTDTLLRASDDRGPRCVSGWRREAGGRRKQRTRVGSHAGRCADRRHWHWLPVPGGPRPRRVLDAASRGPRRDRQGACWASRDCRLLGEEGCKEGSSSAWMSSTPTSLACRRARRRRWIRSSVYCSKWRGKRLKMLARHRSVWRVRRQGSS